VNKIPAPGQGARMHRHRSVRFYRPGFRPKPDTPPRTTRNFRPLRFASFLSCRGVSTATPVSAACRNTATPATSGMSAATGRSSGKSRRGDSPPRPHRGSRPSRPRRLGESGGVVLGPLSPLPLFTAGCVAVPPPRWRLGRAGPRIPATSGPRAFQLLGGMGSSDSLACKIGRGQGLRSYTACLRPWGGV